MKIHDYAGWGDVARVAQEAAAGVSLEQPDEQGRTPLMVALASRQAPASAVQALIETGADVNALARDPRPGRLAESLAELQEAGLLEGFESSSAALGCSPDSPPSIESALTCAAKHASPEKIELLLAAGADAAYVDPCGYGVLLGVLHRDYPDSEEQRLTLVERVIDAGAPLDAASHYGESAVSVSSGFGRFRLLELLCRRGADMSPLQWTDLHRAVAFGERERVQALLASADGKAKAALLAARDRWERTPLLIAVLSGDRALVELLLREGAQLADRGRCGETAISLAIMKNDAAMLQFLIDQGASIEDANEFGDFPLKQAAQAGADDCARLLLAAGADPARRDEFGQSVIHSAATVAIVEMLAERGEDLSDLEPDMRRTLCRHDGLPPEDYSHPDYPQFKNRVFGRTNPQRMNNPFWEAMVRSRDYAWAAAQKFGEEICGRPPVWCFRRFGQSLTRLPDGRLVEIGGEHEDFYDPDFCIYNDVVVHRGDGEFDIFGYPQELFPPTDFHAAALVDESIYIIGGLRYAGQRVEGRTTVFRLCLRSMAIEPWEFEGEGPGWIQRARARVIGSGEGDGEGRIQLSGGEVLRGGSFVPSDQTWLLDVNDRCWRMCDG